MAIELGKFDPSRNIDERDLYCLVDAVYSFKSLGGNEKYKNENISIGLAFERFLYPVLSKLSEYDRSFNFDILFIGNKCLTSGGKERTPSLMTFCRRMGLVNIGEVVEPSIWSKYISEKKITPQEFMFVLLSKQGVYCVEKSM